MKRSKYLYGSVSRIVRFKKFFISKTKVQMPSDIKEGERLKLLEQIDIALVYGEAYFDVSPSSEHKESRFKVCHKKQEVEV